MDFYYEWVPAETSKMYEHNGDGQQLGTCYTQGDDLECADFGSSRGGMGENNLPRAQMTIYCYAALCGS